MPPGMDPSFLFRSPLLSDAENNNLMAAAAAEKARAMMLMSGARPPPPLGFFPGAAIAAAAAAAAAGQQGPNAPPAGAAPSPGGMVLPPGVQSLPQLYTLGNSRENPAPLSLPPGFISQWQVAAAAAAGLQNQLGLLASSAGPTPGTPTSPQTIAPGSSASPPAGAPGAPPVRPIFPTISPSGPQRFSPYIIPPKRSPSPGNGGSSPGNVNVVGSPGGSPVSVKNEEEQRLSPGSPEGSPKP